MVCKEFGGTAVGDFRPSAAVDIFFRPGSLLDRTFNRVPV